MLESMTHFLRPTRAEVSDVAGAVFEMATATMLSGESAVGINPENVVKTMAKIHRSTEKNIPYNKNFLNQEKKAILASDAISKSICTSALELKAKLLVIFTSSGESVRQISKHRISTPIFALTSCKETYYKLALEWNTFPYFLDNLNLESENDMQTFAKELALKKGFVKKGDKIIIQYKKNNATSDMLIVATV